MGNFSHAINKQVFQLVHALKAISDLLESRMKAKKIDEEQQTLIIRRLKLMPSGPNGIHSCPGVAASWCPPVIHGVTMLSLCFFRGHLSVALEVNNECSLVTMQLEADLDDLTGPNSYCSPNWDQVALEEAISLAELRVSESFFTVYADLGSPAEDREPTVSRAFVV